LLAAASDGGYLIEVPVMPLVDSPENVKEFARGDVIAEEGSAGGGWYVLLSGRVAVFKQGTKVAEFSTRGMIFGEISSILSKPRTARLVAVEPCLVMHFEANLDELVTKYPAVAKTVLVSLAQRLEKTTEALWVAVQSQPKVGEASAVAASSAVSPAPVATPSLGSPST
jgi:CRP-like cAMP-binding protein